MHAPDDISIGDQLQVFIYLDRSNNLCATTQQPYAEVCQVALLQVKDVGPHGAFLDWGIDKDLLAPFSEQPQKMLEDRNYLVYLCHDQSGRPIASAMGLRQQLCWSTNRML